MGGGITMTNEMTNEEKALEMYPELIDMSYGALPGGDPIVVDINLPQREAFLAGAQWKDEQHKQEKQQLIDEACEWIKELMIASDNYDAYDIQENLRDFKKAMKGE